MGREHDIIHFQQLRKGIIAKLKDIQSCPMNRSCLQRLHQGMFIDQRPAGGIDQDGRGFHLLQLRFADDVIGLRCVGCVERDEIRFGQ